MGANIVAKYNLEEIPEPVLSRHPFDPVEKKANEEKIKWSGPVPVPQKGTRVIVRFNGFGKGTIKGYFIEHDWLGVYVACDKWPEWWIKQNKGTKHKYCMAFGAEIELLAPQGETL